MKSFKKILINIIALLLVFALVSCGEIVNPNPNPNPNPTPTPGTGNGGTGEGEGQEQAGRQFKVTLSYNGEAFIPKKDEKVTAEWYDGQTRTRAELDENGVATANGLDGEYFVSLSTIPEGYTYNPNIYKASNENTDVTIELYKLTKPRSDSGNGKDYYSSSINITKTGYYRATVKKKNDIIYFRFIPPSSGVYVFESLVSISQNNVNPILYYYESNNPQFIGEPIIITGGQDGFTSNFSFTVKIDDNNISQSGGGRVNKAFAIAADITDGEYPVYIDFKITYLSDYEAGSTDKTLIVPGELDKINVSEHQYDPSKYVFVNSFFNIDGQNIFEDDFYKYNPDTGFYHLYDPKEYPETAGFGPILYAHVTSPTLFTDSPFTTIEEAGNSALTVNNGTENYKLFIMGFWPLTVDPGANNPTATTGPYLCDRYCPCRTSGTCQGGCPTSCSKCLSTCRRVPAEGLYSEGYKDYANSDGLCPVTEELKQFLQKFAITQSYFIDGMGWVEIQSDPPYHSGEDDQWLFACGYYLPR